jgi:hypothetical protein
MADEAAHLRFQKNCMTRLSRKPLEEELSLGMMRLCDYSLG